MLVGLSSRSTTRETPAPSGFRSVSTTANETSAALTGLARAERGASDSRTIPTSSDRDERGAGGPTPALVRFPTPVDGRNGSRVTSGFRSGRSVEPSTTPVRRLSAELLAPARPYSLDPRDGGFRAPPTDGVPIRSAGGCRSGDVPVPTSETPGAERLFPFRELPRCAPSDSIG